MVTVVVEAGRPVALIDNRGGRVEIARIEEAWRIDDEWWREPVQRHYYRVMLACGSVRTIYHDIPADAWYEQRY
jgi:hypothetical protein